MVEISRDKRFTRSGVENKLERRVRRVIKPGKARCRSLMGHERPNETIDFESGLTSTPDISLRRTE